MKQGSSVSRGAPPPRLARNALGMTLSDSALEDGVRFVRQNVTIDIHSHPGRFFMASGTDASPFERLYTPPFTDDAIGGMSAGGVGGVLFAAVADCCLLDAGPSGLRTTRDYAPGEVWGDYQRQIEAADRLLLHPQVQRALDGSQVAAAHSHGKTGCMLTVEGGDFIEDELGRVADAYARGVRSITIIHYHNNRVGDPQTGERRYGGLSPLGKMLIGEMNRVGMLIDLAHASLEATAQAAELSSRPMVISHSNLADQASRHARLLTLEHARLVTAGGGLIGAIPAGFGQTSFADYVDTILRMIDALGVGHVAIGTDMDFTYRTVFGRYEDWPLLPAALLARGMHRDEVGLIMGGNILRVLAAVAPTA